MLDFSSFHARSLLFAPGDSPRKLEKAGASSADLVVIDLEDSVAEDAKEQARLRAAERLRDIPRRQPQWVRINPIAKTHALLDLAAIVPCRPDGVMLPKATRGDADVLHCYLTALEVANGIPAGEIGVIVVATETPKAIFGLGAYAGTPRLSALTWGAEDISVALGASNNRNESGALDFPYEMFRALCLAGAAAAGVCAIETIHPDLRDAEGLMKAAVAARRAGFKGMMAIHPDQVPVINAAFTPSPEERRKARMILDAFEKAQGRGSVAMGGVMLDLPHLRRAKALLGMKGADDAE